MDLNRFTVLEPRTVDEARAFLRKYKDTAVIKAGGTALIPEMKMGLVEPEHLVLLANVDGMAGIKEKKDGLHIGARATLHDIKNDPGVKKNYKPLLEALSAVSAPGLHYQSTIGGNLCQNSRCINRNQSEFFRKIKGACYKQGGGLCHSGPGLKSCRSAYQGDLAPMLICLGAKIVVASPRKEEKIALAGLYSGRGENPIRLKPNQMITEIIIPPLGKKKAGYAKFRERGSLDYPEPGVAVMLDLDGKKIKKSLIAVTGVGPGPVVIDEPFLRSRKLDKAFVDDAVNTVYSSVKPVANLRSPPSFRKNMTKTLLRGILGRWVK